VIELSSPAGSVDGEFNDAVGEVTVEVLRLVDEEKSRSTDGKGLSGSRSDLLQKHLLWKMESECAGWILSSSILLQMFLVC
jgi:hypothetical protein